MAGERQADHTAEEKLLFALFGVEPKPEEPMTPEKQARMKATGEKLRQKIEGVLGSLDDQERKVIGMRYGLGDGYIYTSVEVAKTLNITPDAVRTIEESAVRKLRDYRAPAKEAFPEIGDNTTFGPAEE